MLEKPGALMLYPIYQLLFDESFLFLTEDQISISYKTYDSQNEGDMQALIDEKLTPGKISRRNNLFILFKNTHCMVWP